MRVLFPDTEGGSIDLPVGHCVQAAVKMLRPSQESPDVDLIHYRQQAWNVVQVSVFGYAGTNIFCYTVLINSTITVYYKLYIK